MKKVAVALLFAMLATFYANAEALEPQARSIILPHMQVQAKHRQYSYLLLKQALAVSSDKFGPVNIIEQTRDSVIKRQLVELNEGAISVAVAMAETDWLEQAQVIRFPILKGLASYRMFFTRADRITKLKSVQSLAQLKQWPVGQGDGWSTNSVLQKNGFNLVLGTKLNSLFKMLQARRFDLLMRSSYEVQAELPHYQVEMPELRIAENIAVFTYLPMYFFVAKDSDLQVRLEYGLKQLEQSGLAGELFSQYFSDTQAFIEQFDANVFYLSNPNIGCDWYENDEAYVLKQIKKMAQNSPVDIGNCLHE